MRRILISMFRLPAACFAAALCASGGAATQPVADEALHVTALRAIFPRAQVSIEPGRKLNLGGPNKPKPGELTFPDALADEDVYRVSGKPTNELERTASDDLSNTREVRVRLFRWPNESGAGLLAVLQYDFPGVTPAGCCWSIGLLVHLRLRGGRCAESTCW
jgi:hypothetical protein